MLKREEIKISIDGRGRAFDNIFVERLWRNVKYEDVYVKGYATVGVINQIEGPIITLRDGANQVNFCRSVAKQQLSAPSWVNARFRA